MLADIHVTTAQHTSQTICFFGCNKLRVIDIGTWSSNDMDWCHKVCTALFAESKFRYSETNKWHFKWYFTGTVLYKASFQDNGVRVLVTFNASPSTHTPIGFEFIEESIEMGPPVRKVQKPGHIHVTTTSGDTYPVPIQANTQSLRDALQKTYPCLQSDHSS